MCAGKKKYTGWDVSSLPVCSISFNCTLTTVY